MFSLSNNIQVRMISCLVLSKLHVTVLTAFPVSWRISVSEQLVDLQFLVVIHHLCAPFPDPSTPIEVSTVIRNYLNFVELSFHVSRYLGFFKGLEHNLIYSFLLQT